jgi:hypothetical protein
MHNDSQIEIALQILREIKEDSSKDSKYGFTDDWNTFIKKMQFLSPKSYGTRIQNRIIEKNSFEKLGASDDKGDFKNDGKYFEFKTTILTPSNTGANFVNVRPYQEIDGYYCLVVNTNISPYETTQFYLTKEQMDRELVFLKANASNGTIASNKENKNVSYRFTIDFSTENESAVRWINEYKINTLKL